MQEIRNACSERFWQLQLEALGARGRADVCIMELALDETEEPCKLDVRSETVHVMTAHARVFERAGLETKDLDIIMPVSVIESTSAETLKAALFQRLPVSLSQMMQNADRFTLVLNTDSGPSCLRLGRHLASLVPTLSAPCRMHQGCLAMVAVFTLAGVMSALFCTSLLLRRRRVQTLMRKALHRHIREHLKIVYEPTPAADRDHVASVLELMERMLALRLKKNRDGSHNVTKRISALRQLKRFLGGPLSASSIVHYCPYGCHASQEEAADELERNLNLLFLDSPPPVPAWNKWAKVVPPLLWFACFMSLNMLLQGVIVALTTLNAPSHDLEFDPDDLVGLDDQKTFLRQEQARFTRAKRFLTAEPTRDKLMSLALTLVPTLRILGKSFEASRRNSTASIFTFIAERQSPAMHVIRAFCERLRDEQSRAWLPLRGGRAWTTELYLVACTPMWLELGQVFTRLVKPFRCWPWRLGLLVADGELTDQQKQEVAQEFIDCCSHVCPFTAGCRRSVHTAADVLSNANLSYLRDLFLHVPVSNIMSEDPSGAGSNAKPKGV